LGNAISRAKEHEGRFSDKYQNLPTKDHLLVDFRPARFGPYKDFQDLANEKVPPLPKFLPNYWIVVYNDEYKWIRVTKYSATGDFQEQYEYKLLDSSLK